MKPRRRAVTAGVIAALLTIAAGRWGLGLFTESEFVHFSVNFPTEQGLPTLPLDALQSPWARLPPGEWTGYPAGGILVWGREGALVVDMGAQGMLKKLAQPWVLLLSTHWLRNVGTSPRRIQLDLELCNFDIEWVTFERDWNPTTLSSTRTIDPTRTFNMDWIVDIPTAHRNRPLICSGALLVSDADSRVLLTRFPIRIENSAAAAPSSSDAQR